MPCYRQAGDLTADPAVRWSSRQGASEWWDVSRRLHHQCVARQAHMRPATSGTMLRGAPRSRLISVPVAGDSGLGSICVRCGILVPRCQSPHREWRAGLVCRLEGRMGRAVAGGVHAGGSSHGPVRSVDVLRVVGHDGRQRESRKDDTRGSSRLPDLSGGLDR